ncbi:MAG: FAD binding domain-containing protein [bacterium]|nr:FAD binding domain-containing protein [bacterium]
MTYVRARSTGEVVSVLVDHGDDARILAGGQSLIPIMSAGLARPSLLVDVMGIDDHPGPALEDGQIRIGFRARHIDAERANPAVAAAAPLLPAAAPYVGSRAVRNRGTVVGSVAHADPAGEWPAVATALDATAHIVGVAGSRSVPVSELMLAPLWVDLAPDEMIVSITIPTAAYQEGHSVGAGVYELAHRRGDYAIVGCVAQAMTNTDGQISEARFSLFGLGDVPWRSTEIEDALAGAGRDDIRNVTRQIPDQITAVTDAKASAGYRKRVSGVVAARALERAFDDANSRFPTG